MTEHQILNNPETKEQIKIVGLLHFIGNIASGGLLGTLLVIGYLIVAKNITGETKQTIYDIINFNISFFIYMVVSFILMVVLIGFLMIGIWAILWFVFLVIGFIKHLNGERYEYPLSIKFLK